MGTRNIVVLLVSLVLAFVDPAEAQQPKKTYRIGMLNGGSASTAKANYEAFREGLRQLGYVEGTNGALRSLNDISKQGPDKPLRISASGKFGWAKSRFTIDFSALKRRS